jgi:hypothetical protein
MRERYDTELDSGEPLRVAVGRVRLRSVARVGFSIGWIISLIPALLTSGIVTWILYNIWRTLNGWTPWTPWPSNTRIAGFTLPTPEFRPREALRVDGFYQFLGPLGQHPLLSAVLGSVALTIVGGILFAIIALLAGLVYNLFARATGGLEFELVSRERRRPLPAARPDGPPRLPGDARTRGKRTRAREEDELALEDEAPLRW